MSNSSEERDQSARGDGTGIGDEDLPEDVTPGEENPLAYPLDDDVSREDLGMDTPGPVPDGDEDHED